MHLNVPEGDWSRQDASSEALGPVTRGLAPMSPPPPIGPGLVQVAGVIDRAEAVLLQECGVRYLGFPLRLPVNREDLTEAEAAAIIRTLAPPARAVLITYLSDADEIHRFCDALGARI